MTNSYGSPVFKNANCWWLVVNDLCRQAVVDNKITILSDGTPVRDFIHSVDIFEAVKIIIEVSQLGRHNTFNLSSGSAFTILELAEIIASIYFDRYNKIISLEHPNISCNSNKLSDKRFYVDNTRLKDLGFSPTYDLKSGVNELFTYLEKSN